VKKLRILVLVHETLVPPETLEGCTEQQADDRIDQATEALVSRGLAG